MQAPPVQPPTGQLPPHPQQVPQHLPGENLDVDETDDKTPAGKAQAKAQAKAQFRFQQTQMAAPVSQHSADLGDQYARYMQNTNDEMPLPDQMPPQMHPGMVPPDAQFNPLTWQDATSYGQQQMHGYQPPMGQPMGQPIGQPMGQPPMGPPMGQPPMGQPAMGYPSPAHFHQMQQQQQQQQQQPSGLPPTA